MATAITLDYTRIGLAVSDPNQSVTFSYTELGTGGQLINPGFMWLGNDPFVTFWDADGLYASLLDEDGQPKQTKVDGDTGYGYYLGTYVGANPDGSPQVFYNEMHTVE